MTDPPPQEAIGWEHFAYFVVRVRVPAPDEVPSCAGVVELVGTGRKRPFPDGQCLLRLLTEWSHSLSKMRGVRVTGNDMEEGAP